MLKKYAPWTINRPSPSMNTDLTMMKLITVKGEEHDQFKNLEKVNSSPHMYSNAKISSQSSIRFHPPAMRPDVISKQNTYYFATPVDLLPPSVDEQISSIDKSSKDASITEGALSTSKRNHKHHHYHHHHHHNGKRHCYHHRHHNRQRRDKNVEHQQTILSPSKIAITNSKYIDQEQQPVIVYHEVPRNKGYTVDTNTLASISSGTDTKSVFIDDQQTPLVVYRNADVEQSIVSDGTSQPILLNQNQETKTSKGNILLQSIQNKLVSQREAPVNETKVSTYPPLLCTASCPSVIDTCCAQEVENIYYEDSCCIPSPTIICESNSCIVQQPDPYVCCPQQQQLFLCTEPNSSQDYICSTSNSNCIQQISCPQQQYICVDNTPSQAYICVPEPPRQTGQYLKISSGTPQVLQCVQPQPIIQTIQTSPPISKEPNIFRHALVRTVGNRTGIPVPLSYACGPQHVQLPRSGLSGGATLASNSSGPFNPFTSPTCSIM